MAGSSELVTLLEREANAEREKILAEAREQAEAIRAEARKQAEEVLSTAKARLEAEERAAMIKAQSTAQLRASSAILQTKEEEIARIFADAEAELGKLAQDPARSEDALRRFVEEGIEGFAEGAVVLVNPRDESIVQKLVQERGWKVTIRPDSSVRGGARISTPDGRFVVTNTLMSRLDRARPALAAEVAKALWG